MVGWPLGEDGRKLFAGTALYGGDGEPLALSRQVWIVPRSSGPQRAESATSKPPSSS